MHIGGFQKTSLSDFPGRISAIIFTQGCNFRCPYCHNPELADPARFINPLDEETILGFLRTRRGKLQGIVVTGGEPTVHADLPDFLERLKSLGFRVKLDTNGSNPALLEKVIEAKLIDYCAMDIKAPLHKYSELTRSSIDPERIGTSVCLLKSSSIPHELRTTVVDPLLSVKDVIEIGTMAKGSRFILQRFRRTKILDPDLSAEPTSSESVLRAAHAALLADGIPCETG